MNFYSTPFFYFLFQGKERYLELISQELETHGTVYQPPGHSAQLPSNIINHGLLTQDQFLQLLRRAKVITEHEPMPQCLRTHEDNYYLDLLCKLPWTSMHGFSPGSNI